jgi:hypothetical protein
VYNVNGALMTVIFFCCRVLVFPLLYHMFAKQLGEKQGDQIGQTFAYWAVVRFFGRSWTIT